MSSWLSALGPKGEAMTCPSKASVVRQAADHGKFLEQCLSTEQCPYHEHLNLYIVLQRLGKQVRTCDTVTADLDGAKMIPSVSCHMTME